MWVAKGNAWKGLWSFLNPFLPLPCYHSFIKSYWMWTTHTKKFPEVTNWDTVFTGSEPGCEPLWVTLFFSILLIKAHLKLQWEPEQSIITVVHWPACFLPLGIGPTSYSFKRKISLYFKPSKLPSLLYKSWVVIKRTRKPQFCFIRCITLRVYEDVTSLTWTATIFYSCQSVLRGF